MSEEYTSEMDIAQVSLKSWIYVGNHFLKLPAAY